MKTQSFEIVDWQDNCVVLLDQRLLPQEEKYVRLTDYRDVAQAIQNMTVRGAPAIGVTAAFAVALGALQSKAGDKKELKRELETICNILFQTRPTAVNLEWGLNRMKQAFKENEDLALNSLKQKLIETAKQIKHDDIQTNRLIGKYGQEILEDGDTVLTHCNAGALATAGYGTALGVIYAAREAGKNISVYCDETRPVLQGARLSAWELKKHGVPVTVITDSMAGWLMKAGKIQKVIVGADRIAANGDAANKIGTYSVAINAKFHNIPFYVAAPFSTIDIQTKSGKDIPIEERNHSELSEFNSKRIVPEGVAVFNPSFDVTDANLIWGILTERGVILPPYEKKLADIVVPLTH